MSVSSRTGVSATSTNGHLLAMLDRYLDGVIPHVDLAVGPARDRTEVAHAVDEWPHRRADASGDAFWAASRGDGEQADHKWLDRLAAGVVGVPGDLGQHDEEQRAEERARH